MMKCHRVKSHHTAQVCPNATRRRRRTASGRGPRSRGPPPLRRLEARDRRQNRTTARLHQYRYGRVEQRYSKIHQHRFQRSVSPKTVVWSWPWRPTGQGRRGGGWRSEGARWSGGGTLQATDATKTPWYQPLQGTPRKGPAFFHDCGIRTSGRRRTHRPREGYA